MGEGMLLEDQRVLRQLCYSTMQRGSGVTFTPSSRAQLAEQQSQ